MVLKAWRACAERYMYTTNIYMYDLHIASYQYYPLDTGTPDCSLSAADVPTVA